MTIDERFEAIDVRCEALGIKSMDLMPVLHTNFFKGFTDKEVDIKIVTLLEKVLDAKEKDKSNDKN